MTSIKFGTRPHLRIQRQRGQITMIAGVLMIGLLGIVGLGIDGGMSYVTKARLNAAVDSAAVAAARAVTNGTTQAEQTAAARQAATDFFNANFPNGYLRGTPTLNATSVTFDQERSPSPCRQPLRCRYR